MPEQIALVTGATSGIGIETALGLARAGFRVGLVGRDAGRTCATAARIQAAMPGAAVDGFVADLSRQAEIRRLAADVFALYPHLDVLVNNAGAIFDFYATTADGLERTWALDHLAYMQLSLALLDLLKAGAPARIVSVASARPHRFRRHRSRPALQRDHGLFAGQARQRAVQRRPGAAARRHRNHQ